MPRRSAVETRSAIFRNTQDGVPELRKVDEDRQNRTKRTYLLPDDVVKMLARFQLARWDESGEKPDLSDLVAEAIREYIQKNSQAA